MSLVDITLCEYAIRYCITRDSYAWFDGLSLAESCWGDLSQATQDDVLVAIHAKGFERARYPEIASAYAQRYKGARCVHCKGTGLVEWDGRRAQHACIQCSGTGCTRTENVEEPT